MIQEHTMSAFVGSSSAAIRQIFELFPDAKTVLDPTYGRGVFYKETPHLTVVGGDISPSKAKDYTGDFRRLPFPDNSFDAVVIDPPFLQGGPKSAMESSYETFGKSLKSLVAAYLEALSEAKRVSKIFYIAKCSDAVESSRFVPMASEIMKGHGWPYDVVLTIREHTMSRENWVNISHFRHNYSWYLIWKV